MQRSLAILVAFGVLFSVSSCSKKAEQAPQTQQKPAVEPQPVGPEWKISLKSKCTSDAAEECVGHYGFTILADGRYEVGPGPAGQIQAGSLQDQEFAPIKDAIAKISAADAAHPETCQELDFVAYSDETVSITKRGAAEQGVLHVSGSNLCFQSATAEVAQALHTAIHDLAQKYYSLPFPDACNDAANSVQALYAPLQTCQADADCAFVNDSYEVVGASSIQYIATDNCSKISPLVVGNIKSVFNAQGKLREALSNAQSVCGDRLVRFECTGYAGFSSDQAQAVCRQNVCVKAGS